MTHITVGKEKIKPRLLCAPRINTLGNPQNPQEAASGGVEAGSSSLRNSLQPPIARDAHRAHEPTECKGNPSRCYMNDEPPKRRGKIRQAHQHRAERMPQGAVKEPNQPHEMEIKALKPSGVSPLLCQEAVSQSPPLLLYRSVRVQKPTTHKPSDVTVKEPS
ncbi:hypothetical protein VTK56DRAFT_1993 [Thermocarpiscus australiensis]